MTSQPTVMEENLDWCLDRGEVYANEANERGLFDDRLREIDKALDEVDRKLSSEIPTKKFTENKLIERIQAVEFTTVDGKPIVHLRALRKAMPLELVQEVLVRYKAYGDEAQRKEAASKICSSYCKVFAILLKFSKGKFIANFMDQNIDDSNLPLQGGDKNGNYGVPLKNNLFGSIEGWPKHQWQNFFHWQWTFLPTFFARPGGKVLHYRLESDDILPIIKKEDWKGEEKDDREEESSSDTEKPVQIKRLLTAYGGHSTVSKIKFDPLSCHFGEFRFQHRDGWYALKKLTGKFTWQDFLSEVYVWKLFNDKGEDELHLSPLLCTFEKPIGDGKSEYCLLLPWASGDLRQLWENISSVDDRYSACWMVEQCWRIAEALSVIHQDKEERNPIKANGYEEQLYSRHGDIKPGNILWFAEHVGCEKAGTLVLADFGISKSHRSMTKSLSDPEKTKNSPTYKAPEFDSKGKLKIGRKSDIWGLACTWIEFVTWHVKGWQAVNDDFPNRRDELDPAHENISQDMFFSVRNGVAVVKPGVIDWIRELHEDNGCSPFIRDFLSFIQEKMLLVDPTARATAGEVLVKMKEFLERIRSDSTYANSPLP